MDIKLTINIVLATINIILGITGKSYISGFNLGLGLMLAIDTMELLLND